MKRRIHFHQRAHSWQDFADEAVAQQIHNDVFGSYGNKLKVIDAIVDDSCEGLVTDRAGRSMIDDLFSRREQMSNAEWKESVDMMDCVLQNNLYGGVANKLYGEFLSLAGEASIK